MRNRIRTSMQPIDRFGSFRVVLSRQKFITEYQVRAGGRILSRHGDSLSAAIADAKARDKNEWTSIGATLRAEGDI